MQAPIVFPVMHFSDTLCAFGKLFRLYTSGRSEETTVKTYFSQV